jgi:hypothetical protein
VVVVVVDVDIDGDRNGDIAARALTLGFIAGQRSPAMSPLPSPSKPTGSATTL